jgi:hypothetical protein
MDFESPGWGSTVNFPLGGWVAAQPVSEGQLLFRSFGGGHRERWGKTTQWFIIWLVKTAHI